MKNRAAILAVTFLRFGMPEQAIGMSFEVVTMRGEPAILARGEIVRGDAARLQAVFKPSARHSYGYYALVLESPGGNVQAAFELSRVIDSQYVNTYVAPGATCVSACAAILFIAGREHIAVSGSYLGFHGCYGAQTGKIENFCNEAVAEHAYKHGTAYGAVMSFIEKTPPDKIVWVSGDDADCWGINKYDISEKPVNYLQCVIDTLKNLRR